MRAEARRVAGASEPELFWGEVAAYRDFMLRDQDDSRQVAGYRKMGVAVHRGAARILVPGRVDVEGGILETERIVVATGSEPAIPPIERLADAGYWTNRQATTTAEIPQSLIVLGGGLVGVELGQLFARLGAVVTIVEAAVRLIPREDPAVGELVAGALRDEGIGVLLGARASRVSQAGSDRVLRLADGHEVRAHELLVAAGRRPRVAGLGLENSESGPARTASRSTSAAAPARGVWAVGDVTGGMPFTLAPPALGRRAGLPLPRRAGRALPDRRGGRRHRTPCLGDRPDPRPGLPSAARPSRARSLGRTGSGATAPPTCAPGPSAASSPPAGAPTHESRSDTGSADTSPDGGLGRTLGASSDGRRGHE